jgi:hypothetical protein
MRNENDTAEPTGASGGSRLGFITVPLGDGMVGVAFTRVGSLSASTPAPAVRVILFGWSLYFGRLIVVKTHHFCPDEIAESKGWIRERQSS